MYIVCVYETLGIFEDVPLRLRATNVTGLPLFPTKILVAKPIPIQQKYVKLICIKITRPSGHRQRQLSIAANQC